MFQRFTGMSHPLHRSTILPGGLFNIIGKRGALSYDIKNSPKIISGEFLMKVNKKIYQNSGSISP